MQAHACIARKAVSITEAELALWWSLSKAAREVVTEGAEVTIHRLHGSMGTGQREATVAKIEGLRPSTSMLTAQVTRLRVVREYEGQQPNARVQVSRFRVARLAPCRTGS